MAMNYILVEIHAFPVSRFISIIVIYDLFKNSFSVCMARKSISQKVELLSDFD